MIVRTLHRRARATWQWSSTVGASENRDNLNITGGAVDGYDMGATVPQELQYSTVSPLCLCATQFSVQVEKAVSEKQKETLQVVFGCYKTFTK